jgi:hypothetical protein
MTLELPDFCYAAHNVTGLPVLIKRGEPGYSPVVPNEGESHPVDIDAWNAAIGVSHAQQAAMVAGSMFGWDVPAACPALYDEQGVMIRMT